MNDYVLITIRRFSRLIPRTVSHSVEEGVQAKVKDPLWFLGRQWQLGEYRARNGGNMVRSELSMKTQKVEDIKLDEESGYQPLEYPEVPIEAIVEQELGETPEETITPTSWDSQKLEYSFSIRGGNTELKATEYSGDHLDWYFFRLNSNVSFSGASEEFTVSPEPISFPGMPHARWWEFEDGNIDLGDIRRPNLDFLSMLLIEFALIFSNDWFVIPLDQQVGGMRWIERLVVVDTFGIFEEIDPIVDDTEDEHLWSMFTIAGTDGHPSEGSRFFLLPNTTVKTLKGEPVEHISIARDELANLVFAVEHQYWANDGTVVNRNDEEAANVPDAPALDRYPLYRLKSHLPRNWIPYVPVQKSQRGDVIFRRGRTDETATPDNPQFKGQILRESVRINEEEIPATPIELSRRFKLITFRPEEWELVWDDTVSKWSLVKVKSREVHSWMGRSKKPGARKGSSGLKYDYLIEE